MPCQSVVKVLRMVECKPLVQRSKIGKNRQEWTAIERFLCTPHTVNSFSQHVVGKALPHYSVRKLLQAKHGHWLPHSFNAKAKDPGPYIIYGRQRLGLIGL